MDNEQEKYTLDSIVSREIVKEIMDFGISQAQIYKICKFLIYELDDIAAMKDIAGCIDKYIVEDNSNNTENNNSEDGLITEI